MLFRYLIQKHAVDPQEQTIYISHADCLEDAEYLAELIRNQVKPKAVEIRFLTPVIGAHAGPGTLAVFCAGASRV